MAQPAEYTRRKDFTDQDGDDTDHNALNQEFDAAALSINGLRDNLALIQKDDGSLKNRIVGKDQLADNAFDGFQQDLDDAVARATTAADESTRSAVASGEFAAVAQSASQSAAQSEENAAASAANAAGAAKALFDGIYLGSLSSDPTVDGNGQSLTDGDFYFNNVAKLIRTWDATSGKWVNATPSGQFKRQAFEAVTDFTPGTTTTLTLASDPQTVSNIFVHFDAAYQQPSEYSLSGQTLTFTSPIPVGVQSVAVAYLEAVFIPITNAILSFPEYAAASAAAATLPDGQVVEAPDVDGRMAEYAVQGGVLVFKDYAPDAIRMQSYTALRAYGGKARAVDITTPGFAGRFNLDAADTAMADNGGTVIVDSIGRRWKRSFDGFVSPKWFGAIGDNINDDILPLRATVAFCWSSGKTLDLLEAKYKISGTLDFTAPNTSSGSIDMPYKIVGAGPARTVFNYTGNGTAIQFDHPVTQKSVAYGVIDGGFSVINSGSGVIGINMRSMNHWNTAGATLAASGFSDKNIFFDSNDQKGGLWNFFGPLISTGNGLGNWGVYVAHNEANANQFMRIMSYGDYVESAVFVGSFRNTFGLISVDTPSQVMKSCVRVKGECLINGIELEGESVGNPNFVAAIMFDANAKAELHMHYNLGLAPRFSIDPTATVMITPLEDMDNPISGGRATIITSNGLVIDKPLINSPSFFTQNNVISIGVNTVYGAYQSLFSFGAQLPGPRGTNILRSAQVTNNTNVAVEFQIRNRTAGGVVGANNLSKTVAAGGTYEFTAHEISFLIGDATDIGSELAARFRTSSAAYTGGVNFSFGGYKI